MATKKPLSQLNMPQIKASDWLATFDKLPGDIIKEGQTKRESLDLLQKAMSEKKPTRPAGSKRLRTPVKASDWFAVNNKLPDGLDEEDTTKDFIRVVIEPANEPEVDQDATSEKSEQDLISDVEVDAPKDIDVSVTLKPIRILPAIAPQQDALNDALFDRDRDSDIEDLIDSILNLTKAIQQDRLQKVRGEVTDNEPDPKKKQGPKSLTQLFKTIASDRYTSVKEKMTIRNLLLASGARSAYKGSGSVLDQVLDYVENRKPTKVTGESSLLGSVVGGTSDYLGEKIRSATSPASEALRGMVDRVSASKVGRGVSTVLGGAESLLNAPKSLLNRVNKMVGQKAQEAAILRPHSLIGSISRRYIPSIAGDKELQMSQVLTDPGTPEEKKFTKEVRKGMRDELLELNEEQLVELKKMVRTLTLTKEEKFEKEDAAPPPLVSETAKKEEKEKEGSLLSNILDKFGGKKLGKGLGKGLGKLKNLGGAALRGGAALATNPAVLGAAGVAGAGAAGYGVGSLINKAIIDPAAEAITGTQGATLGTAIYDGVDKVKGWFGNSDQDKMDRAMGKGRVATGKIRDLTKVEPKQSVVSAANSYRVEQMKEVKDRIQQTEILKEKKEAKGHNSQVVDARTTVVNNAKNVQYVRPQVQNNESTFNNLLRSNFSH